jgi:hypothetical protein
VSPIGTAATIGLLHQPQIVDDGDCGAVGGMRIWQGKPKYSEKTCPSATLSSTDPTWPDQGSNTGRCGRKPAINRLNYGTVRDNSITKCSYTTSSSYIASDSFQIISCMPFRATRS